MYKRYGKKNNFTLKNIILYSPQRDKDLNTSKEKIKNGGTNN
jgi:hypothetical protein